MADAVGVDWDAVLDEMRAILIGCAKRRETITYSDLARTVSGVSLHHRAPIFHRLLNRLDGPDPDEPSLATLDKLSMALGTSRSDLMQAAGLIDKALVPRESDDERRLLSVYRDLSDAGRDHVMRYARFLHHEEHNWQQASFVPDEDEVTPRRLAQKDQQPLALFDMDA